MTSKSLEYFDFKSKKSEGAEPRKNYHLNEKQAALLMTYLKNTAKVLAFKKELVRQFYAMRTEFLERQRRRTELKPIRRELTDVIREVDNGRWSYKKYTDLAYKSSAVRNATQLRKERGAPGRAQAVDYLTADEIAAVAKRQSQIAILLEEMQIALRTRFQETPDTPYVQKLLSEITTGAKMTLNDNGVATTIVTRKGIDLQANEAIKPIVKLRPYRTFQEVEQPESVFLIRVSERGIAFIEADGGMWKLKARETVKVFLEDKLSDLVNGGAVIVAL